MEKELPSYTTVWEQCLDIIRDTVSSEVFSTIFEPINAVSLDKKQLTLELPSLWIGTVPDLSYISTERGTYPPAGVVP